jgi:hypothetical protein
MDIIGTIFTCLSAYIAHCGEYPWELLYFSVIFCWLVHIYLLLAATYQNTQGNQGENDPNNTTVGSLFYFWYHFFPAMWYWCLTLLSADICWGFGCKCNRWLVETSVWPVRWADPRENTSRQALWFCSIC